MITVLLGVLCVVVLAIVGTLLLTAIAELPALLIIAVCIILDYLLFKLIRKGGKRHDNRYYSDNGRTDHHFGE